MARKTKENNRKNTKEEMALDLDKEIIIGIKTLPEQKAPKKNKSKSKKQIEKNYNTSKEKNKNNKAKSKKLTKTKE